MNFCAVLLIAILVALTVRTYKTWHAVLVALVIIFGMTVGAHIYGLHRYHLDPSWSLFGDSLTRSIYLHFIYFWYLTDICCSFIIFRSYRNYLKINAAASLPQG